MLHPIHFLFFKTNHQNKNKNSGTLPLNLKKKFRKRDHVDFR